MDARQRKSREKIVAAFCRLTRNQSLDDINFTVIATEAGVSRQTLYSNFSGKDAILDAYMDRWLEGIEDTFGQYDRETYDRPEQILSAIILRLLQQFGEDYQIRRAIAMGHGGQGAVKKYRDFVRSFIVEQMIAYNLSSDELDQKLFPVFSSSAVSGITDALATGDLDLNIEHVSERLAQYLLFGVGVDR